jgi:hypothetical protein
MAAESASDIPLELIGLVVLLAGDMLSDVLIPLLDPRRLDQVGAYETALDRLGKAARHVDVHGHGAVAGTYSQGFSPVRKTGDEQDRAADKG